MKKYSFLIAGALFLSACNVTVKRTGDEEEKPAGEAAAPQQKKVAGITDPVCGMEKESSWTEYKVNGSDTTWFCSPHCKETYGKNPEKYAAKPADAGKS